MRKPTMKIVMRGQPGNKWKSYEIMYDGKEYVHQNRENAMRQFSAAKRVWSLDKKTKKLKR